MKNCKVHDLSRRYLALGHRASEIDVEMTNAPTAMIETLRAELTAIDTELTKIDVEASSRYTSTIAGAVFQIAVARRAIERIWASRLTADQQCDAFARTDHIFESITRYLAGIGEPEHWGRGRARLRS